MYEQFSTSYNTAHQDRVIDFSFLYIISPTEICWAPTQIIAGARKDQHIFPIFNNNIFSIHY